MKYTIKQLKDIESLKIEGKLLKTEYDNSKRAYEQAKQQEQQAKQYVLDNYVYLIEDDWERGPTRGDRITSHKDDFLMSDKDYEDFLKHYQEALKELFNIEVEYNHSHSSDFFNDYLKSGKNYLKIAPRFLKIIGKQDEALVIEKQIDGYLKEEYKEKLLQYNDGFLR